MAATYEASLVAVTMQAATAPTLVEVCRLKWTSLTIVEELGGAGSVTISTQVDTIEDTGKTRLARLDLFPCEIWVRRTTDAGVTTMVAAGPVIGCQINGRTITIVAGGLLTYLAYWLRETAYAASNVDQATIVQQLVDTYQALNYGHRGIITSGLTATGVTRDLTIAATAGKWILPSIVTMGGRTNGFDLTIDPSTRSLLMWSPRKSTDRTGSVFLDRRSIGTPNLAWTVAAGTTASEVFASSSSDTGVTLSTTAANTTLRATFGRTFATRTYNDISIAATLAEHAARAAVDVGSQVVTVSPELIPVTGVSYRDFEVGDLITYDFDAGLGAQTFTVRVASIEVTFDSGREVLKVGVL